MAVPRFAPPEEFIFWGPLEKRGYSRFRFSGDVVKLITITVGQSQTTLAKGLRQLSCKICGRRRTTQALSVFVLRDESVTDTGVNLEIWWQTCA